MATIIGQKAESVASLTFSALDSLTSNSLAVSSEIDFTTLTPDANDVQVEIVIDPGATTGNKKFGVFLATSLDGTNFSDTINRGNLLWMGDIQAPDTNVIRSPAFSCRAAMGGLPLPAKGKIVVWNDTGVTTNSSGNSCQIRAARDEAVTS